jgi:hypothetical protein
VVPAQVPLGPSEEDKLEAANRLNKAAHCCVVPAQVPLGPSEDDKVGVPAVAKDVKEPRKRTNTVPSMTRAQRVDPNIRGGDSILPTVTRPIVLKCGGRLPVMGVFQLGRVWIAILRNHLIGISRYPRS